MSAREPVRNSLPETARPDLRPLALGAGLEVREEGESYRARPGRRTPADERDAHLDRVDARDPGDPGDDDPEAWIREAMDEADLEPAGAATAGVPPLQAAQRHLDDAVNLVGLLLDALERRRDCIVGQARTALELAVESLHQAHRLVGEQDLLMEESDGEELEDELPPMGD